LIEADTVKILNIQEFVGSDFRDWDTLGVINTQVRILQSRPLAEQVVKSLRLDQNPDFLPGAGSNTDFAAAVQGGVMAKPQRDAPRMVDVSFDHVNPQITALVANGVAQEFIRQNVSQKMSASSEALNWLRQQIEEIKPKLEKAETALQDYRERVHAVSLEENQNIVIEKLKAFNTALTKAHTERLAAENEWNQIEALLKAGQEPASIAAVAADKTVALFRQQLAEKQLALVVLRQRYKEKYPAMISATAELNEVQEKLKKACDDALQAVKARHISAIAQEESLRKALQEQEREALDLDRKLTEYNLLKRNVETDRQLYNTMLTRMKEASVAVKMEKNNIRLVEPAMPPGAPYKPDRQRIIMVGAILSLVVGIGLCFIMHTYDDRVKAHDDIEAFGVPLLCNIPRIQPKPQAEAVRIVTTQTHSMAAEAFRNLRASLCLSPSAKDAKVILITSSAPAEGKSFVAVNLALVFAANNERTLLVDCDLRHPSQHHAFKQETADGLSMFLADSVPLDAVIHHSDTPNLDIIFAGRIPPNPPELLGTERLRQLLETVRSRYQRVILDSAPVTVVSDPLILLPQVDGVVFVVQFAKVRRGIVGRALQKVGESSVPIFGAVMNNIDLQKHGYYYYPYSSGHYNRYYRKPKTDENPAA
jgi:capsular exopolysaccharide synthesis family protein